MPNPLPTSFTKKKASILAVLSLPIAAYNDLSPKGSIDEGIRDLIDEINAYEGFVTTSSCAGRVSVFAEGKKRRTEADVSGEVIDEGQVDGDEDSKDADGRLTLAAVGGKGGGGRWLFVSHDRVPVMERSVVDRLGMRSSDNKGTEKTLEGERLVHFKFEPMILHILTASFVHAQLILSAALQAGFRESGALNLTSTNNDAVTPMVAIRSMGLSLESVIGYLNAQEQGVCVVSEAYIKSLLAVANERFDENAKRIERFQKLLRAVVENDGKQGRRSKDGVEWEDKEARRERKRAEGLMISRDRLARPRNDTVASDDT